MALKIEPNVVKLDIGSYVHYWRGTKKSGKTRLFYELVKKHYGDLSKGLLIAVGNEIGYKALNGIFAYDTPTWADLEELVDDLVENKDEYSFEIIGFDTVDEMVKLAVEEVKRLHRKAKGVSAEFNACFGGYAEPRRKLQGLIDDIYGRLERAGYGIVFIGHSKYKDIKEKNGDEYQKLGSNLNEDYDSVFANHADIVMTISEEKEITDEKLVESVTRYMYFRTDGFVDAGGRFEDMPDRLSYGADNYLLAFEQGVKGAIGADISDKELEKKQKAEVKARAKAATEYSKSQRENKVYPEQNEELVAEIKSLFDDSTDEQKKSAKEIMAENGLKNFKDVSDVPTRVLQSILDALKA